jgi:uncharacterized membrane protein
VTEQGPPLPDSLDAENPYAPPHYSPAADSVAGLPFTVQDVFQWSWTIFSERMSTCLSIFWAVAGIRLIASFGLSAIQNSLAAGVRDEYAYKILWILSSFATYVLLFWVEIGLTLAMIKIARGELVSFEDIFSGGHFLLTLILAWIVRTVLLAIPILVAVGIIIGGIVLMENQSGVAAFLLYLFVSGIAGVIFILMAARLSIFYYLVIDRNAGVFESLIESWRMCRNQVATVTLVYAVEFAVVVAGILALCVGLVFAAPLMILIDTVMYLAILTGASSGATKPRFSIDEEA